MNPTTHLAHELFYADAQCELAAARNAWQEVEAWELLRAQIRDTRSILIRQQLPPPDRSSPFGRTLHL